MTSFVSFTHIVEVSKLNIEFYLKPRKKPNSIDIKFGFFILNFHNVANPYFPVAPPI